jgi:uncharacterized protein YegL
MLNEEQALPEAWEPQEGDPDDWGEGLLDAGLEFVDNPESRCPCVLVLDSSRSMAGPAIAALNQALQILRAELGRNVLAGKRVELALVSFGLAVDVAQDFVTVDRFVPPVLEARGETPLGAALIKALDLVTARTARYRAAGISYFRPWVFLITDGTPQGEPLDVLRQAVQRLQAAETNRKIVFFAVGVQDANMKLLAHLSTRPVLKLHGLRFAELFTWLSVSIAQGAQGLDPHQVALAPTGLPGSTPPWQTGQNPHQE